ncbi:MAG: LVIVD repeat-containing protein, partial [Xanthobacteraceae bacterium]
MNAVASRNIKFISHSDQGGRGDGVQVMVNKGYAYIGHGFSNGITIIDVRDVRNPKTVNFLPCAPNTRAHHLQTATHKGFGDLLLAVNGPSVWTMQVSHESYFQGTSGETLSGQKFTTGLRVYDLSKPEAPREIAFLPLGGLGPHRIWYVGGRYAYVSVHLPEFSDHVLVIVDMAEPTRPQVVGKFWLPGMWTAGGELPTWPKGKRYALHHALVAGNLAYSAWRDGGMAIVDIADPSKPTMVCHCNWDPPFGGGTHSPLPLPDRDLLVVADEANFANCSLGLRYVWIFDVRVPGNPVSIATLPVPDEADYCKKGGNFGPHNLWENRPGAFVSSR